jgi:hypothetical protein
MKKGCLFLITICIIIIMAVFTIEPLGVATSNQIALLHRNGYFIPKESTIYKFKETKSNTGSGEYWLYGEDDTFYFFLGKCGSKPYSFIKKTDTKYSDFDKHDYTTWKYCSLPTYQEGMQNEVLACGDLLKKYAQKPKQLEFVKCERVENSQTIVRATYRVSGDKSKEVEDFLVKNYGMGKLKWVCCGWESGGKYGGFKHPEFKEIHPFLTASISMYASGEVEVEDNQDEIKLEFDRNKIAYFMVEVELAII